MPLYEQYANLAETTLSGDISAAATVIHIVSPSLFPSQPQFRIEIVPPVGEPPLTREIMLVTGMTGQAWTVVRGVEGTAATGHTNGDRVVHVLTRDGLLGLVHRAHPRDLFDNRPTESLSGMLFFSPQAMQIYRRDSAGWLGYGPIWELTPPNDADFSWVNQGTATVTATGGVITIRHPAAGTGSDIKARVKTAPTTGVAVTVCIIPGLFQKAFHTAGIHFRESSTGRLHVFDMICNANDIILRSAKYTTATGFNSDYQTVSIPQAVNWLRIVDDGTNRRCFYSFDGQAFHQFHSVTRLDFLTGGADQVGFHVSAENSVTPNMDAYVTLLSWREHPI